MDSRFPLAGKVRDSSSGELSLKKPKIIGELFNLEPLSMACEKAGRWSFLFTSAPLNIPGGIASPPCAVAVL